MENRECSPWWFFCGLWRFSACHLTHIDGKLVFNGPIEGSMSFYWCSLPPHFTGSHTSAPLEIWAYLKWVHTYVMKIKLYSHKFRACIRPQITKNLFMKINVNRLFWDVKSCQKIENNIIFKKFWKFGYVTAKKTSKMTKIEILYINRQFLVKILTFFSKITSKS